MQGKKLLTEAETPVCKICNKKPCKKNGKSKFGFQKYKKQCVGCHNKFYDKTKFYQQFKKYTCENCGFIPLHTCQLDVDHIDGNHDNNNPSNFQTLCANCHRLKTFLNKDWKKSY